MIKCINLHQSDNVNPPILPTESLHQRHNSSVRHFYREQHSNRISPEFCLWVHHYRHSCNGKWDCWFRVNYVRCYEICKKDLIALSTLVGLRSRHM